MHSGYYDNQLVKSEFYNYAKGQHDHLHQAQTQGFDPTVAYLPNNYIDQSAYDPYSNHTVQAGNYDQYSPQKNQSARKTANYDNTPLVSSPTSTKDKIINWLVYLLPLIFAIFNIIICGILFLGQSNKNSAPTTDINATPFLTMTQGTQGVACTTGTQQNIGDFEGVSRGCVCQDGTTASIATCPFKSTCNYISPVKSINFPSINKKIYCGQNASNWQYVGSQGTCPSSTTSCSSSFCVGGTACPITTSTKTGTNIAFSYVNSQIPIVQLFVSPGSTVCFNPSLTPQFSSQKSYPLLIQKSTGCDKYQDLANYSTVVDSENWVAFLKSNNDYQTLTQIPLFSNYISETDTINFVAVSRIKTVDSQVCNSVDPTKMFNVINDADNTRTVALIGVCIVFFLCLIILVAAPLFYFVRAKVVFGHDMSKFPHTKFLYVFFFVSCLIIFILSGGWIYKNYGSQGLSSVHDQMKKFSDNNCFPDQGPQLAAKNVFNYTGSALGTMNQLVPILFYIDIGFFALGLILLLIQHFGLHEFCCTDPWDITHLHIVDGK